MKQVERLPSSPHSKYTPASCEARRKFRRKKKKKGSAVTNTDEMLRRDENPRRSA